METLITRLILTALCYFALCQYRENMRLRSRLRSLEQNRFMGK
jgi:hypothetical protein